MKTKRYAACALALCLLMAAGLASANTSVLRTDDSLSMSLDGLSGTEAHVLVLAADDILTLSTHITAGEIEVLIRKDIGDTLYQGAGGEGAPAFIRVGEAGIYRISVTGKAATGSLWLGVNKAQNRTDSALSMLVRAQSDLGYGLTYDPVSFDMTTSEDGLTDTFTLNQADGAEDAPITLAISREAGSLADLTGALLAEPGARELASQVIDWRAARVVLRQESAENGGKIQQYTLIETAEDEVLMLICTYFAGAEGAAEKMENMIQTISFTR